MCVKTVDTNTRKRMDHVVVDVVKVVQVQAIKLVRCVIMFIMQTAHVINADVKCSLLKF